MASWKEAQAGTRQVVLVGGDPGMGKTRLLAELAGHVHQLGGLVLWGRCDADAVVPYQPWVELLRQAWRPMPRVRSWPAIRRSTCCSPSSATA